MKLRNNQGFTLIEIAIVLTIVGLIIGGIWIAASTVFNNNKAQQFTKDLIQIMQNTKSLFAGQGSAAVGTGFVITTANNAGVFPSDMVSSASSATTPVIITPFSTTPTTSDVTVPAADVTATTVGYAIADLTTQACSQALTTIGSQNNVSKLGVTALKANGVAVAVPTTAATASASCTAAGTGNSIDITMTVF